MGRKEVEVKMPGINLKHYDRYLTSIELYAKACGVKIKYAAEDGDGSYEPHKRLLRIDPDLSHSAEIAILLHELGHCLDDTLSTKKIEEPLSVAYHAVYKGSYSKKQLRMVIKCELRAWKYARGIAKKLRIRLGKWFDEIQNYCIEDYKN